jgi:hypothetical protein
MTTQLEDYEVQSEKIKTTEYNGWYPPGLSNVRYLYDTRPKTESNCGYGYITRNLLLQNLDDGKIYDPHEHKGIFRDGKLIHKPLVSRSYAVIPDESIEETMFPLVEGRFKLKKKVKESNETKTFWELESLNPSTQRRIKGSSTPNDIYDVRLVVRNSINGGMSAGIDLDTYRQVCSNGMLGWGKEFSTRIFHYGDQQKRLRALEESFTSVMEQSEIFLDYIEQTVGIKSTKENMQYLVDRSGISKNWLPDWLSIDESKYKVLNLQGGEHTIYETMNDITYKLTRSDVNHPQHFQVKGHLGYLKQRDFEKGLSAAVIEIVKAKGNPR